MESKTIDLLKLRESLPVLGDFTNESNQLEISSGWKWRKGEKPINQIIGLMFILGVGFSIYTFLPIILVMIQNVIWLGIYLIGTLVFLKLLPVLNRMLRLGVRKLHEKVIEHDPIANLRIFVQEYIQKGKMFREAKTKIKGQHRKLVIEATKNENLAKELSNQLNSLKQSVNKTDDRNKKVRLAGTISNTKLKFENAKNLSVQYATQAKKIEKATQALDLADIHFQNKIERLKITVDNAEQMRLFSKTASEASTIASTVLSEQERWEISYALNYIEDSVQHDLANFEDNMNSIITNVGAENMNVDNILSSIENIDLSVKSTTNIMSHDYKLTEQESIKSGINLDSLDDLF